MLMLLNDSVLDDQILFRVEKSEMNEHIVLLDFINSEYFSIFNTFLGISNAVDGPCLLLIKNYSGRFIRQGSLVAVNKNILQRLLEEQRFAFTDDSVIILAEVNLDGSNYQNILLPPILNNYQLKDIRSEQQFPIIPNSKKIAFSSKGIDKLIVKNIGQGSWNEIQSNSNTRVVFDFGTHYNTRLPDLKAYLGNTETRYQKSKPGLIISHWDVDHYHFLKALSDKTIASFSNIVCRNRFPSKLSRTLCARIQRLNPNFYLIDPGPKGNRGIPPPLYELYRNGSLILFNSGKTNSSNMNSLSLLIRKTNVSVSLTADQHYDQFDKYVLNKYLGFKHQHHLIVPHHGGHAGKYCYNLPTGVKAKNAVISVGNNTYGHPNISNINNLIKDGFNVIDMHNRGMDISIRL